jgi:hypothetical protein
MIWRGSFILSAVIFVVLLIVVAIPIAPPLLNWLSYDPQACATYSERRVAEYVSESLDAGRRICSISKPQNWSNTDPVEALVCDGERRSVERVEVYPDCGLEHRTVAP